MRQNKTEKMLPKTSLMISNGGVYLQRVRCGKSNCKCARGETHEAHYFFSRVNGKLTKTHICKAELEQFIEIVNEAKIYRETARQVIKEANESIRRVCSHLRENKDQLEKQKQEFLFQMIRDIVQPLIDK